MEWKDMLRYEVIVEYPYDSSTKSMTYHRYDVPHRIGAPADIWSDGEVAYFTYGNLIGDYLDLTDG